MIYTYATVTSTPEGDFLDGKLLLHGMKVNVQWPEGGSSTHTVEFHPATQNKGTRPMEVEPYLVLKYKGQEFRAALRGSPLKLCRCE